MKVFSAAFAAAILTSVGAWAQTTTPTQSTDTVRTAAPTEPAKAADSATMQSAEEMRRNADAPEVQPAPAEEKMKVERKDKKTKVKKTTTY